MTTTKKRGRRPTNGRKPGWVLARALIAIEAYDRARSAGAKHWFALKEAIDAVRHWFPGIPISETEVKRVLADLRPKKALEGILVVKRGNIWAFGFGKRPDYRRRKRNDAAPNSKPSFAPVGRICLRLLSIRNSLTR